MKKIILDFMAVAECEDGTLYASDFVMNGLYKIKPESDYVEFVDIFPREEISKGWLHSDAVLYEKKVYFIPSSGENLSIYDIENKHMDTVSIPKKKEKYITYKSIYKFITGYIFDGNLWLIPSTYPGLIKVSIGDYSVEVYDDWMPEEGFFFRKTYVFDENIMYIAGRDNDVVLKFDFKTGKGHIIRLKNSDGVICAVRVGEKIFYASTRKKSIISWNIKENTTKEYMNFPKDYDNSGLTFSKAYKHKDKIYFVPNSSNMMLVLDEKEDRIEKCRIVEKEKSSSILYMFDTKQKIFFRKKNGKEYVRFCIDKKNNEVGSYNYLYDDTDSRRAKRIVNISSEGKVCIREMENFDLEDFIQGIK